MCVLFRYFLGMWIQIPEGVNSTTSLSRFIFSLKLEI